MSNWPESTNTRNEMMESYHISLFGMQTDKYTNEHDWISTMDIGK
jgi:hypothetical protein